MSDTRMTAEKTPPTPRLRQRGPATVITSTETQEQAYAQYVEDQRQVRKHTSTALERRRQRPAAKLMEGVITGLQSWWTHYVVKDVRLDCVLVAWMCRTFYRGYFLGSSFLLAHVLLVVGRQGYRDRRAQCEECTFGKRDAQGIMRCHGHDTGGKSGGRTCDCPTVWWWLPSYLAYQIALRNFVCPIGHFGRLGPWWGATRLGRWLSRPLRLAALDAVAKQQQQRYGTNNTGARSAVE